MILLYINSDDPIEIKNITISKGMEKIVINDDKILIGRNDLGIKPDLIYKKWNIERDIAHCYYNHS